MYLFYLEDNYFTILWWFLSYLNISWPWAIFLSLFILSQSQNAESFFFFCYLNRTFFLIWNSLNMFVVIFSPCLAFSPPPTTFDIKIVKGRMNPENESHFCKFKYSGMDNVPFQGNDPSWFISFFWIYPCGKTARAHLSFPACILMSWHWNTLFCKSIFKGWQVFPCGTFK